MWFICACSAADNAPAQCCILAWMCTRPGNQSQHVPSIVQHSGRKPTAVVQAGPAHLVNVLSWPAPGTCCYDATLADKLQGILSAAGSQCEGAGEGQASGWV